VPVLTDRVVDGDWALVGNESGPTRLGFALVLKFFEVETLFRAVPRSCRGWWCYGHVGASR